MEPAVETVVLAVGPNDREHVDALLAEAVAVAKPAKASVYLLHVFPQEEYDELLNQMDIEPTSGSMQPDELAARHDSIRTPADYLEQHNIEYSIRGVVGKPDEEIVRVADELDADRIVIGGAGRSPAGKAVFGDYAQQVLLNASCPVTYVQRA
ncbi:universal stress protein [Haloarcula nitratireducens]|uniref:Universal stress protein n=1 Tax=Haloarcula nitratireducens TaxID=2487749 RepID=A0AAW4PET2_9EURY|nr:universal stress protein [Halomicroarcula nitratireducens]MBX0296871.1 universal stress protein [Halomicroarcula nitratireducens]